MDIASFVSYPMLPEAEKNFPIKKRYREHGFFGNAENVPNNNQQFSRAKSPNENASYPTDTCRGASMIAAYSMENDLNIIGIGRDRCERRKDGGKLLTRLQESIRNSPYWFEVDESGVHGLVSWSSSFKFGGKLKMKWLHDYRHSNPETANFENCEGQSMNDDDKLSTTNANCDSDWNTWSSAQSPGDAAATTTTTTTPPKLAAAVRGRRRKCRSTRISNKSVMTRSGRDSKTVISAQGGSSMQNDEKSVDSDDSSVIEEKIPMARRDRACKGLLYLGFLENTLKKQRPPMKRQCKNAKRTRSQRLPIDSAEIQAAASVACIDSEPAVKSPRLGEPELESQIDPKREIESRTNDEPVQPRKRGRPKGSKKIKIVAKEEEERGDELKFAGTVPMSNHSLRMRLSISKKINNNTIEYAVVSNKKQKHLEAKKNSEERCRKCGAELDKPDEHLEFMLKRSQNAQMATCKNCIKNECRATTTEEPKIAKLQMM